MEIVRLALSDARLMAARFAEHGNSPRRMRAALEEAGADVAARRVAALRRLERAFNLDLGSLCFRFLRRNEPGTHVIERGVMEYVAELRIGPEGEELWVRVDHIRSIRDLMQGRLVGEPES